MQPWGPSEGVGYVNELIARLTDSPVVDETSTNTTLDGNAETFPRGGRRVFVVSGSEGLFEGNRVD
jgi:hypothetical protein